MLISYRDLKIDVVQVATGNRYLGGNDKRLVSLGPKDLLISLGSIALFSNCILAKSSGKDLEDISQAHFASLMYKLKTSINGSDDLSIVFDCERGRKQGLLTDNGKQKEKNHFGPMLRDVFGSAEHQEKTTFGLGYILKLTRNNRAALLNKELGIAHDKFVSSSVDWYVPHS